MRIYHIPFSKNLIFNARNFQGSTDQNRSGPDHGPDSDRTKINKNKEYSDPFGPSGQRSKGSVDPCDYIERSLDPSEPQNLSVEKYGSCQKMEPRRKISILKSADYAENLAELQIRFNQGGGVKSRGAQA